MNPHRASASLSPSLGQDHDQNLEVPLPSFSQLPHSHSQSPPQAQPQSLPKSISPQPPGSHGSSSSSAPRVRRRNRMITSCLECRRRKLKCDKAHPCNNCTKGHRDCIFLAPALDQASQLKLTEIKEKVGSLERMLERDVARNTSSNQALGSPNERALPDDADDDLPGADDERDLIPTPLAVQDAAFDEDAEDDDVLDLGIQIGKMRITERIGGFFRPHIAQELEYSLTDAKAFAKPRDFTPVSGVGSHQSYDYLKPGPAYIPPASGFFFGHGNNSASLIDFLPSRLAADRLIKQYFAAVHPVAMIVHRPSFEREYESFWDEVSLGIEPPNSVQSIVFAAMFSGVVSMDEAIILRDFGVSKESLIDNFKLGTETALGRANFLRTTKVETLQAFIMYLIPLCRGEVSRAHSVLVGGAVRMAECMGLHRDGEAYGLNPLETHIRRLIWYQICFLDIRTCEAQGPRPTIRKDDFDTKLPINIDDIDIHPTGKPPTSADRWTDSTFTIIRFEIIEMMRQIWLDRSRIERDKMSLTASLSKIETFKRNMASKFDHLIDERIPLQKCAKLVKSLMINRLHLMVLHRYHNSVSASMPERLRSIMLASGTIHLEAAVALDTIPDIHIYSWYNGAYQQYHAAFLLLIDVHFYPKSKEADRIWNCLDWVFDTDRSQPRDVRARNILKELQEKAAVYQEMRKMRAPQAMLKHIGQRPPMPVSEGRGFMAQAAAANAGLSRAISQQLPHQQQQQYQSGSSAPLSQVPGLFGTGSTSIGRAPIPDTVFAGVSNGESLWAFPNANSPDNSSDSPGSAMGQLQVPPTGNTGAPAYQGVGDAMMPDIDWDAFDALFPPDQNELNAPMYGTMNPSLYGI